MKGVLAAASMAALFAVLGAQFAPMLIVSGAVLGLVVLRHGLREALKVAVLAALMTAVFFQAVAGQVGTTVAVVMAPWVPVICATFILRHAGQPGRAVAVVGMFVAGVAFSIRQAVPDIDAFWAKYLAGLASTVKASGGQFLTADEVQELAKAMHHASLGILMAALVAMVLTARWWQSALYRPGAFGTEFRALSLPVWALPALVGGAVVMALAGRETFVGQVAGDAVVVLMLSFGIQGLAVAHERVAANTGGRGWLVGLYLCLALLPQVASMGLAMTGLADVVADFRRLRRRAGDEK